MTQNRLSALALLSIENDVAQSLDYCDLINDFSLRKSRIHNILEFLNIISFKTFIYLRLSSLMFVVFVLVNFDKSPKIKF